MMSGRASLVVDPALGELYRRMQNKCATRDWLAEAGMPTGVVDAEIAVVQAQIQAIDDRLQAAMAGARATVKRTDAVGSTVLRKVPTESREDAAWVDCRTCVRDGDHVVVLRTEGDFSWVQTAAGVKGFIKSAYLPGGGGQAAGGGGQAAGGGDQAAGGGGGRRGSAEDDDARLQAALEVSRVQTPSPRGPAADYDDQMRQAMQNSLAAPPALVVTELLPVPPGWHQIIGGDRLRAVKAAACLTNIESKYRRSDLDGGIVLEGPAKAVREAKELLQPLIDMARAQQRADPPELFALLEFGYDRENARRALLETVPRGEVSHRQRVEAALEWLLELEAEPEAPVPVPVPAPAPATPSTLAGYTGRISQDGTPDTRTRAWKEWAAANGNAEPAPEPEPESEPEPEPELKLDPEPEPAPALTATAQFRSVFEDIDDSVESSPQSSPQWLEPAPAPAPVRAPLSEPEPEPQHIIDITGMRRCGLVVDPTATMENFCEALAEMCEVSVEDVVITLDGNELVADERTLRECGIVRGASVNVADHAQPESPVVVTEPEPEPELEPATGTIPIEPEPEPTSDASVTLVGSAGVRVEFTGSPPPIPQFTPPPAVEELSQAPSDLTESGFSTISYAEAGIQPKLKSFSSDDPGIEHVHLTQCTIMWAIQTIIDHHGDCLKDIDVEIPSGGTTAVCRARQSQTQGSTERCTDTDMQSIFAEDFQFAMHGAGGRPNPHRGCLDAVGAVQHAIETQAGPVGFRMTISTADQSSPQELERWAVVLNQGQVAADNISAAKLRKEATVAMRTLYSFSRLVSSHASTALQFDIDRLRPDAVSSALGVKRATAVATTFGLISVDLEYVADGTIAVPEASEPVDAEPEPERYIPAHVQDAVADAKLAEEPVPAPAPVPAPTVPAPATAPVPAPQPPPPVEPAGFDVPNPASWKDIDTPSDDVEYGDIAGPGAMVGRYCITQKLGNGSFGEVWKATVTDALTGLDVPGIAVAIKTMVKDKVLRTPGERVLVENEIKSMQTVNHPNVVRLFEPLYSDTHIYMVLDFCQTDLKKYMGAPLGRGLPSRAPLSEAEAKPLMRDFAAGMQALRKHKIIHRDLKDENLLIAMAPDGRKVLKIADFGFAKQLVDLAATVTEVGSPAYMAPEVFTQQNRVMRDAFAARPVVVGQTGGYDAKSDLWGVGCILYGILCKGLVFSDAVRTKPDLVNELANEMRDGVQKSLPAKVEFEHGRVFDGPASQYDPAAEESAASRRCRQEIAAEAGVREDLVSIIGARSPVKSPQVTQGKVIVKYQRSVQVSASCNDLLRRLLQHHPDDRIEWEDFFAHPWLAQ